MTTFTLSIEETEGKSRQHGFHLGTIESVARDVMVSKLAAMKSYHMPIVSMALIRDRKIVDVLYPDGTWQSEIDQTDYDQGPNGEIRGFR